jgi:hypothetical protein
MTFGQRIRELEKHLEANEFEAPVPDLGSLPPQLTVIHLPDNGRLFSEPLKRPIDSGTGNVRLRIYPMGQCPTYSEEN